jgi:mannose-6-phosphate isomerase-like protein (cupin superfamily)
MPQKIATPTRVPGPGNKIIEEFVGRVHTDTSALSIAHMIAPPGWEEPAQQPEFDEVTIMLRGTMRVEHADGVLDVGPGEVVFCEAGERIRYTNPSDTEESEYWAVCVPAFGIDTVNRDAE